MAGTLTISTLKNDTGVLATQNGMTGIAKAWCNYNGVSQTVTQSFNISSVTRNAVGDYTFNFTTAMANANYVVTASPNACNSSGNWRIPFVNAIGASSPYYQAPTSSAFRVSWTLSTGSNADIDNSTAYVAVFSS